MGRAERIKLHTFNNGMRAVINTVPGNNVEYFGISFKAGSADEDANEFGLAHFVEHTIFKGTERHKAGYILNRLEELGGELNAFTNKEETVVYTVCPAGYINRSMDLVADIVSKSVFPDSEIEKERLVIMEEIDSYLDTPSEAIFDELDELIFEGSPLAHNILGTAESVGSFSSDDCKRWMKNHFTADNAVVFYSGPLDEDKITTYIEKYFSVLPLSDYITKSPEVKFVEPFDKTVDCPGYHQCHVATAYRIPGIDSNLRPEIILLCNILGGPGMNSTLNLALREKRGLVYQVDANTFFYTSAGAFVIYYGCDKQERKKCAALTEKEVAKFVDTKIKPGSLSKAIRQYLGQLSIAYENREQRILSAVKSVHCRSKVDSYEEVYARLSSITPDSLWEAAQYLASNRLCRLTLT